jgi:2,3-bisphosphoglycerate-independent phosphoglycerate mutase
MNLHDLIKELREPTNNGTKIVLLVADGLGGLPLQPGGLTELETARRPNLDALAKDGVLGLSTPVLPGITPGSGPGHLGLFGYDPLEYRIGRGVLEALGINFHLERRDVAARGNFCTLDASGKIADRRAGRPSDEENRAIVQKLKPLRVPGAEVMVEPVSEHRFVVVFRGDGLGEAVNDTDPQALGVKPLEAKGADPASQKTADLANRFAAEADKLLKDEKKANGVTLRGFARYPHIPTLQEITGMRCAALAVYPMYKGLARLVGMDVLDAGHNLIEQAHKLKEVWGKYDFFFVHFKYTDKTGEDGNFAEKVRRVEELDAIIPEIIGLKPDVLIVTGDHSTPSRMKTHSWHPVPTLLWGQNVRTDEAKEFNEGSCLRGGLGQFEAKHLLTLALAHAGRLAKYGA